MARGTQPLLTIGIIFKDDIRCIEHCLKALQPLRNAVPCELVMADTGASDGSREIAEKYADTLLSFPWIDDFSAARNAVMDRASGVWYLSVDTDEYLHSDVSQLVKFLAVSNQTGYQAATVIIRSYDTYEMDGSSNDFMALRLVHMSTGVRYHGAVHEHWDFGGNVKVFALSEIIFDHDGYVETCKGSEAGKAKQERNIKLIREALVQKPDDLMIHMQLIESGWTEPDYLEQIRTSVELTKKKVPGWEKAGPPLFRYALFAADGHNLPEFDEWLQLAEDTFPESMYIRLDVEYLLLSRNWKQKHYAECIQCGERFLTAMSDYHSGKDVDARMFSTLKTAEPSIEQGVRIILAGAYQYEGKTSRALELLNELDYTKFTAKETTNLSKILQEIQLNTFEDTAALIITVWDGISIPKPSKRRALERQNAFIKLAGIALQPETRESDPAQVGFCRPRYTLYQPLHGRCEMGTAAAVLDMQSTAELETALYEVKNWDWFSIHALAYALSCGVNFPLHERPLDAERMDSLAKRLLKAKSTLITLALREEKAEESRQNLFWRRGLLLTAVRAFDWADKNSNTALGIALARAFARMERVFLPLFYSEEALREENHFMLPLLHRFGWYAVQAFDALDNDNQAKCIHCLKKALSVCPDMQAMVSFLLEYTPELTAVHSPPPSEELKALAGQIRSVLSMYAPDDPAVMLLKQSDAYQQVAYLIEGTAVPVKGGLPQ